MNMKTISQYREDVKNLMDKVAKMDTKATGENRDLTDPEIEYKNEVLDAVEDLNRIITTLERQERVAEMIAKPEEAITTPLAQSKRGPRIEIGEDLRAKDRFKSFGEQLACVLRAGTPGGSVDPRLWNAASGLNETTPSDGGLR